MWLDLTIILISFLIMTWSSDLFVDGAIAIADHLKMPKVIIGTVLVGFTTAVPELLVSFDAAINGSSGIAIGNALGSYIINIALVLGITALIIPIKISKSILKREVPVMAFSLFIALALMSDGYFGFNDGVILLLMLLITIIAFTVIILKSNSNKINVNVTIKYSYMASWLYLVIGLMLLIVSARMLTSSAVSLAQYFGVSDLIIGLTIVAIGTSLPELAASVAGVKKGEDDIAIGNVIGSNILGMFAVLAMPAIFSPGSVPKIMIYRDFAFMGLTTITFWIACYCFDGDKLVINRVEGLCGIFIFFIYIALLYFYPA